jgi:hypothetical protein
VSAPITTVASRAVRNGEAVMAWLRDK